MLDEGHFWVVRLCAGGFHLGELGLDTRGKQTDEMKGPDDRNKRPVQRFQLRRYFEAKASE